MQFNSFIANSRQFARASQFATGLAEFRVAGIRTSHCRRRDIVVSRIYCAFQSMNLKLEKLRVERLR